MQVDARTTLLLLLRHATENRKSVPNFVGQKVAVGRAKLVGACYGSAGQKKKITTSCTGVRRTAYHPGATTAVSTQTQA